MANKFSVEAMFKASDGMSPIMSQIERRAAKFASGVGSSLEKVDKFNAKVISGFADFAKQAAAVGAVLGGAVGFGLDHIIKAGAGFEQSITNVGAVMGKSRGQIQDLEKEAMRLGVVTQFSSSEVAEAMEFMARKGFDSGEILSAIPGVLNAVAASGQGMAEVATVVGSAIRGFGLEAAQAGRVANILAFVAEKTGATITDLGTALSTAAPTAKTLGVSIEDTAVAVGLLQKVGLDASTAGSSVATMLAKISKPSSEIAGKMAALGIKFKDAKGNMLPFRDVLGQFVKVGSKVGGNMDRMAFFAELVGLRGDKAALALSDMAKSGDFDKLASGVQNVGNYAEKVAKIRLDTTQGSWKLLTSTVEVLETKLFNLQSGPLRGIIDTTNAWLQANQDLITVKAADYIDNLRFAIDLFASGAKTGFNDAKLAFTPVVWLLGVFSDKLADSGTWPGKVHAIGEAFGVFTVVAGTFLAFAAAVKVARGAVIAFEVAQKAVSVAVWLGNAAVTAYTFVTDGSAIATGLLTAANWAGRAAMIAGTIATGARNVMTWIAFAATTRFTLAQIASKVASVAATAVTWLWNTAQGAWVAVTSIATTTMAAYETATVSSTGATEAAAAATELANLSMGTFLLTVGAAAAAVGALYLAYKQYQDLLGVSGGTAGIGAGIGSFLNGDGYAKGVDDYQNTQARDEAEGRGDYTPATGGPAPQVAPPNPYAPRPGGGAGDGSDSGGGFYGEVTVRAAPGTSAAVTKAPGGGHKLNLAPSGTP